MSTNSSSLLDSANILHGNKANNGPGTSITNRVGGGNLLGGEEIGSKQVRKEHEAYQIR